MTDTKFGETRNDSRARDSAGDGHPRRTFLKGVGLLGAGAVFGPSLASPAGATSGSAIPSPVGVTSGAAMPSPTATVHYLPVGTEFEVTYGGADNDGFWDVIQASDGGYVLAGQTRSFGGGRRGYAVKTDDEGAVEWDWVDTDRNPSAFIKAFELDDGYLFSGQAEGTSLVTFDYWLVKTDFDGTVEFSKTYAGPGRYVNARDAIPTADGGFAITGEVTPSGRFVECYLVKTDGNGDEQWTKSYGTSGYESAFALLQTADDGFLLGGRANDGSLSPPYDHLLVKTDADGIEQWRKRFSRPGDQRIQALAAAIDGYLLAGFTNHDTAGDYDVFLVKTDFDGNVVWEKTYGGAALDRAFAIVATADGGYALVGETESSGAGGGDGYLVTVDADGAEQMTVTFGGPDRDRLFGVVRTSDSGYALAGLTRSTGAGGQDAWLVKTDPIPFTATLDCDAARPARVTVTNVGDAAYELRDIDSAGIDALTGRPVLDPGETYTMDDLPNGTAVFRAFEPGTNNGVGPRLRVEIDCPGFESQPLEVSVCGGRVTITNVGNRTVQVRDLDGRGGDLITGRPRLDPDEALTKRDVAPDTYYVQAWDRGENEPLAPPVEVVVEDDEAFFDVDYVVTGSSTTAGDEYEVDVGITNTGTGDGARCVDLGFDDEIVATKEVKLDAAESTEIRFVLPGEQTIEFEPNRSYTVTADTGDDTGSTEKYVLPPA